MSVPTHAGIMAALLLVSTVGALPVSAQFPMAELPGAAPSRHVIRVGFGGGVSVPTDAIGQALNNGVNGQAFLLLDPGLGFPLRFNFGYQRFAFDESSFGGLTGQTTILSGVGGLNVNLFRLGPVRPYVMAGLGAFSVRDNLDADGGVDAGSQVQFGIDGGGGIAFKLGRLEAFVEGRVQNIYTDAGMIDTKSIKAVPVSFGILF